MTNKPQDTNYITEVVSLNDLSAYLKKHNLEIVPQSIEWKKDGPHIWIREKKQLTNISESDKK